jgi:hypothetical protein
MYNLLLLFKLATELENKIIRFMCMKYIQNKYKKEFFIPFKEMIKNDTVALTRALLESFLSFYFMEDMGECKYNLSCPYIIKIYDRHDINTVIEVNYNSRMYFTYEFIEECVIRVKESIRGLGFRTHVNDYNIDDFYESDHAKVLFVAIYNRCVEYIYGNGNNGLYNNRNLFCEYKSNKDLICKILE